MELRIDKLLAHMGYGTRKEVKKLLKSGAVKVDGAPVRDAKTKVRPDEQIVTVWGETVEYKPFIYLMMNKPSGSFPRRKMPWKRRSSICLKKKIGHFARFRSGGLTKIRKGCCS